MEKLLTTTLATVAVGMFALSGCADPPDSEQFSEVSQHDNEHPDKDPHAGHAHPTHGPHGGDLIELGNEEYHAELVHPHGHDEDAHHTDIAKHPHDADGEESHTSAEDAEGKQEYGDHDHGEHRHAGITIYILDAAAKNAVAISATEITLNLSRDGNPAQFKLAASPDTGDPENKSSRFSSTEKELLEFFHESEHVSGTLVLDINGTSFRGQLVHSHDDDHGHAHGEDDEDGDHAH